jgi:hypothetical protein
VEGRVCLPHAWLYRWYRDGDADHGFGGGPAMIDPGLVLFVALIGAFIALDANERYKRKT